MTQTLMQAHSCNICGNSRVECEHLKVAEGWLNLTIKEVQAGAPTDYVTAILDICPRCRDKNIGDGILDYLKVAWERKSRESRDRDVRVAERNKEIL